MFCTKCGTQCKDGAKFCKNCGAPLVAVPINNTSSQKGQKTKDGNAVISIIIALIVVLIAVIGVLVYLFFIKDKGKASAEKDTESAVETEESVAETPESEETVEEPDTEPVENPEDDSLSEDTAAEEEDTASEEQKTWQEAYLDYIDSDEGQEISGYSDTFALIYVNDDDIPELVFHGGSEVFGCYILTYADGEVDILQTDRLNFSYIERGNRLCNSEGNSGYYYDIVWSIEDGKWTELAYGTTTEEYDADYDEPVNTTYTWNDETVSESEYNSSLNEVYDTAKAKYGEELPMAEIISYLNTGTYISNGHRYEFVIQDVTWEEAAKLCEEKGGYLATITCKEEFENVVSQLKAEDKTKYVFYVGGTRMEGYAEYAYTYHWVHDDTDVSMGYYGETEDRMWNPNEPSYSGEDADGNDIDENCIDLYYSKSDDRAYLNDVSDDILAQAPFYSGIVGYICEYDE